MLLGDFELRGRRIYLRKTGNSAAIGWDLLAEVAIWLVFHLIVRAKGAMTRSTGLSIWFTPDIPHPRYMVRMAALWGGIRIAKSPDEADAAFFFEDSTRAEPVTPPLQRAFNFACTDISKSRVAEVFEQIFGYPLAVDPTRWTGEAVEKSEENGAHDGRIVCCPRDPIPGKTYQRLIDTVAEDGCAYDLRTHCVGGRPVVVWAKRRPSAARFLPPNLSVTRHVPRAMFSDAELESIARFVEAMGADWCGLDILRERSTGRIYIVDVNKTDAGPIVALPLRDKLASAAMLAGALNAMIAPAIAA